MGILAARLSMDHVCAWCHKGQNLPEQELQTIVSHPVGASNQTQFLWDNNKYF